MFIYLDEAGDLGFSERSSPVFVVGVLVTDKDRQYLDKKLREVKHFLIPKSRRAELKFSRPPWLRGGFLNIYLKLI